MTSFRFIIIYNIIGNAKRALSILAIKIKLHKKAETAISFLLNTSRDKKRKSRSANKKKSIAFSSPDVVYEINELQRESIIVASHKFPVVLQAYFNNINMAKAEKTIFSINDDKYICPNTLYIIPTINVFSGSVEALTRSPALYTSPLPSAKLMLIL
ncbi:hypothetical protein AGMMS50230_11010 [Spirochaetia bacterium]|nr:hypothetical protein AGMMS50230_11010 [Spirochaetia bacterium]